MSGRVPREVIYAFVGLQQNDDVDFIVDAINAALKETSLSPVESTELFGVLAHVCFSASQEAGHIPQWMNFPRYMAFVERDVVEAEARFEQMKADRRPPKKGRGDKR